MTSYYVCGSVGDEKDSMRMSLMKIKYEFGRHDRLAVVDVAKNWIIGGIQIWGQLEREEKDSVLFCVGRVKIMNFLLQSGDDDWLESLPVRPRFCEKLAPASAEGRRPAFVTHPTVAGGRCHIFGRRGQISPAPDPTSATRDWADQQKHGAHPLKTGARVRAIPQTPFPPLSGPKTMRAQF